MGRLLLPAVATRTRSSHPDISLLRPCFSPVLGWVVSVLDHEQPYLDADSAEWMPFCFFSAAFSGSLWTKEFGGFSARVATRSEHETGA